MRQTYEETHVHDMELEVGQQNGCITFFLSGKKRPGSCPGSPQVQFGSQVMYRTKAVASELPWGMSVESGSRRYGSS